MIRGTEQSPSHHSGPARGGFYQKEMVSMRKRFFLPVSMDLEPVKDPGGNGDSLFSMVTLPFPISCKSPAKRSGSVAVRSAMISGSNMSCWRGNPLDFWSFPAYAANRIKVINIKLDPVSNIPNSRDQPVQKSGLGTSGPRRRGMRAVDHAYEVLDGFPRSPEIVGHQIVKLPDSLFASGERTACCSAGSKNLQ